MTVSFEKINSNTMIQILVRLPPPYSEHFSHSSTKSFSSLLSTFIIDNDCEKVVKIYKSMRKVALAVR